MIITLLLVIIVLLVSIFVRLKSIFDQLKTIEYRLFDLKNDFGDVNYLFSSFSNLREDKSEKK